MAHPVAEEFGLFLGLEHGKFRSLHDTALDKLELESFVAVFLRDDEAYEFLQLGNEPTENHGVGHVEHGVERGQDEGEAGGSLDVGVGVDAYDAAGRVDEGIEHRQHPEDAEDVE